MMVKRDRSEYGKVYRKKNKDRIAAYQKQYHLDNQHEINARHRRYREVCSDKARAAVAKYRKSRPGWSNVYTHRRRAIKLAVGGQYKLSDVEKLLVRQNGRCHWCCAVLSKYHVDHVWPLSRGGSNDISNIVVSCPTCNLRKHNALPTDFAIRMLSR